MNPYGRDVEFRTSGHTGAPALWIRTERQLHAEAMLIGRTVVGEVERVVSFAPPEHLFGRLFGEVLPQLYGVPVQHLHHDPVQLPDLVGPARTLFVCLPSSWTLLRRLTGRIRELSGAVVLHGSGPTTRATGQVVADLAGTGFRAVELFGSTETGGVAYREIGGDRPWRLFPDIELVIDGSLGGTQLLHVRSPRIARSPRSAEPEESFRLPDLVRVIDERQFEYLGRATRVVKVNGRRCNLDDIEGAARQALDTDVACLAMRDSLRGEHYELYYDSRGGVLRDEEVWRRLAVRLSGKPVPRAVHAVAAIPRTATGKVKLDQLYASSGSGVR